MPRFLVKNKYTYERIPQTDYTYRPDYWPLAATLNCVRSHNAILPLYVAEEIADWGVHAFSAKVPAVLTLTEEMTTALAHASALRIRTLPGAPEGSDGRFRATFFGTSGESFSFVGTAATVREKGVDYALSRMNFSPVRLQLETDGGELCAALSLSCVWNTLGEWGGQAHFYAAEDATLVDDGTSLALTVEGKGGFTTRDLPRDAGGAYSMLMPRRNTLFFILRNPDGLTSARLSFTSESSPDWAEANAVELPLCPDAEPHAYFFNLSLCPGCEGRLTTFRFETEGKGRLYIDGYSFEQEKSLETPAVQVTSCRADAGAGTLAVNGRVTDAAALTAYAGGVLSLYAGTMADAQGLGYSRESVAGKHKIGQVALPADGAFSLIDLPLRLRETTLLPYQLLLFAEAEGQAPKCLCDRFYIENYEDFDGNPYAFDLPSYTVNVEDFGARGDAVHDDTNAIQAAIDHVAGAGGGRVFLPGREDIYGRRYIVTNLLLRSYVELHFGDGAMLWQSQRRDDYPYEPAFGHDGVIPGVNWTHNLHVSNLPLLQGANLTHIKITGRGALRMLDTGSEEGVDMPGYAAGCYRRIHCIPLGLFNCTDVVVQGFDILRSNNYHSSFNHCERVYIADLRLHQVKCVSGDGLGLPSAKHIRINRCFLQSNDDGVVMSTHLYDPRGILWWTNCRYEDNCCRDVTVLHSYLNSGGGKALAFITWGTSDVIQANEEICDVVATDNYLTCVNPVGTWPDNPYAGKQPFDNSETDDYSPVKNVRIFGNRYEGNCTLGPIHATNVRTDCGVHSTDDFRNGDFVLGGMANWTTWPNAAGEESTHAVIYADKEKGCVERFDAGDVCVAQGLHLEAGTHTFTCELFTGESGAELFVCRMADGLDPTSRGEVIASQAFVCLRPETVSLTISFDTPDEQDLFFGIRNIPGDRTPDGFAVFDACTLTSRVDREALAARRLARFCREIEANFVLNPDFEPQPENGKIYLHARSMAVTDREVVLSTVGERGETVLESAIRALGFGGDLSLAGYGYRFAVRDDGTSYRELRVNVAARTLTLTDVVRGQATPLYCRGNFFFTSNDFHIFRLEVGRDAVSVWIDGSQYATIPCPVVRGGLSAFFRGTEGSLCNLTLSPEVE